MEIMETMELNYFYEMEYYFEKKIDYLKRLLHILIKSHENDKYHWRDIKTSEFDKEKALGICLHVLRRDAPVEYMIDDFAAYINNRLNNLMSEIQTLESRSVQ